MFSPKNIDRSIEQNEDASVDLFSDSDLDHFLSSISSNSPSSNVVETTSASRFSVENELAYALPLSSPFSFSFTPPAPSPSTLHLSASLSPSLSPLQNPMTFFSNNPNVKSDEEKEVEQKEVEQKENEQEIELSFLQCCSTPKIGKYYACVRNYKYVEPWMTKLSDLPRFLPVRVIGFSKNYETSYRKLLIVHNQWEPETISRRVKFNRLYFERDTPFQSSLGVSKFMKKQFAIWKLSPLVVSLSTVSVTRGTKRKPNDSDFIFVTPSNHSLSSSSMSLSSSSPPLSPSNTYNTSNTTPLTSAPSTPLATPLSTPFTTPLSTPFTTSSSTTSSSTTSSSTSLNIYSNTPSLYENETNMDQKRMEYRLSTLSWLPSGLIPVSTNVIGMNITSPLSTSLLTTSPLSTPLLSTPIENAVAIENKKIQDALHLIETNRQTEKEQVRIVVSKKGKMCYDALNELQNCAPIHRWYWSNNIEWNRFDELHELAFEDVFQKSIHCQFLVFSSPFEPYEEIEINLFTMQQRNLVTGAKQDVLRSCVWRGYPMKLTAVSDFSKGRFVPKPVDDKNNTKKRR